MPSSTEMKRRIVLLGLIGMPAAAASTFDLVQSRYRDELAGFGRWRDVKGAGAVWQPAGLAPDWRPFSLGQWRCTKEAGWFWQGSLALSAITEHRGRWRWIDGAWSWLPGVRFELAPVAWGRIGDDVITWAPAAGLDAQALGWSKLRSRAFVDPHPSVAKPDSDEVIRRAPPPDPAEVAAAAGKAVKPAALADLVDNADLTAWLATGSRSPAGLSMVTLPAMVPAGTSPPTGPADPDRAWSIFEAQHQDDLQENQWLHEREVRRSRDLVR